MKKKNLQINLSHLLLGINCWLALSLMSSCSQWDEVDSVPLSVAEGNNAATHFVTALNNNPRELERFRTLLDEDEPLYNQIILKQGLDYGMYYFVPYQDAGQYEVKGALYYPVEYKENSDGDRIITDRLQTPIRINATAINNDIPMSQRFLYSRSFVELEEVGLKVESDLTYYNFLKDNTIFVPLDSVDVNKTLTRSFYGGNYLQIDLDFDALYQGPPTKINNDYMIYGISKPLLEQWAKEVLDKMQIQLSEYRIEWFSGMRMRIKVEMPAVSRFIVTNPIYMFCEALAREISTLAWLRKFSMNIQYQYLEFYSYQGTVGNIGRVIGGFVGSVPTSPSSTEIDKKLKRIKYKDFIIDCKAILNSFQHREDFKSLIDAIHRLKKK